MYQQHNVVELHAAKKPCHSCCSAQQCLCKGFDDADLSNFEKTIKRTHNLDRGERLFEAGDPMRGLYAVRSGSIKVYALSDDGDEQVLGFYLPGDVLGLDALESHYHSCAAVALESSSVCELSFERLQAMAGETASLRQQLQQMYAHTIARDHALLRLLGRKSAEQRLAGFLLNLSERLGERGYSIEEFNLSMSRHDIGNYLGLALETVSRLFARFQDLGILAVNRRYVHILAPAELHLRAGECAPIMLHKPLQYRSH